MLEDLELERELALIFWQLDDLKRLDWARGITEDVGRAKALVVSGFLVAGFNARLETTVSAPLRNAGRLAAGFGMDILSTGKHQTKNGNKNNCFSLLSMTCSSTSLINEANRGNKFCVVVQTLHHYRSH